MTSSLLPLPKYADRHEKNIYCGTNKVLVRNKSGGHG